MRHEPRLSPELLDALVDDVRAGRRTIDEAVAAHPAAAGELRDLLEVAAAVAPPPAVDPDPAFGARGRVALMAALAAEPGGAPWTRRLLGRPVLRAPVGGAVLAGLGGLLALAAACGGAVYAAQDALPGDALYPVKRGAEEVRVALAPDPAARAELHRALAGRRADEAERAAGLGRPDAAEHAARAFVAELARAEQAGGPAAGPARLATPRAALERARQQAPAGAAAALATAAAAAGAPAAGPAAPTPALTAVPSLAATPAPAALPPSTPSPPPTGTATSTPTPSPTPTPTPTDTASPTPSAGASAGTRAPAGPPGGALPDRTPTRDDRRDPSPKPSPRPKPTRPVDPRHAGGRRRPSGAHPRRRRSRPR